MAGTPSHHPWDMMGLSSMKMYEASSYWGFSMVFPCSEIPKDTERDDFEHDITCICWASGHWTEDQWSETPLSDRASFHRCSRYSSLADNNNFFGCVSSCFIYEIPWTSVVARGQDLQETLEAVRERAKQAQEALQKGRCWKMSQKRQISRRSTRNHKKIRRKPTHLVWIFDEFDVRGKICMISLWELGWNGQREIPSLRRSWDGSLDLTAEHVESPAVSMARLTQQLQADWSRRRYTARQVKRQVKWNDSRW